MFRQSVFGRLAGYEDVNDALRLRHDPAMRWIIGGKASKGLASPSQMGRFETNWLARLENLATSLLLHKIFLRGAARSNMRVRQLAAKVTGPLAFSEGAGRNASHKLEM
jgi:hypothetical protein